MNRETIYLDELITKIIENKEIGEIMRNAMLEIARSCKTVQKEEMPHYKQVKREEVMSKLAEGKDIYCVTFYDKRWSTGVYELRFKQVGSVLNMIKIEDAIFYERIEGGEE